MLGVILMTGLLASRASAKSLEIAPIEERRAQMVQDLQLAADTLASTHSFRRLTFGIFAVVLAILSVGTIAFGISSPLMEPGVRLGLVGLGIAFGGAVALSFYGWSNFSRAYAADQAEIRRQQQLLGSVPGLRVAPVLVFRF